MVIAAILVMMGFQPGLNPLKQQLANSGYATHGLRAYLDPDTGEYARQPELSPLNGLHALFSAGTLTPQVAPEPLTEVRSAKAGGGFSIDLQDRFRPNRLRPDP